MESVLAGVVTTVLRRNVKTQSTQGNSEKQLLVEIEAVQQSLDMVSARFNFQDDPDLVEACIYEMQALTARYRYLTREARRLGVTRNSLFSLKRLEER
jgi:hypothetical protein